MITIEVNGKSFEVSNAKEANKLIRKLEREAKIKSAQEQEESDLAFLRAKASAKRIIDIACRVLDNRGGNCFHICEPRTDQYAQYVKIEETYCGRKWVLNADTQSGHASEDRHAEITRVLEGPNGYLLAIQMMDEWVAVAVAGNSIGYDAIPSRLTYLVNDAYAAYEASHAVEV